MSGSRVHPAAALAVGAILWFVPTLLLPVLGTPTDAVLRALGPLPAGAGSFEASFVAAQMLRWLAAGLPLTFVIAVERASLSSVGLRSPRWRDLGLAVGIALVALAAGIPLYMLAAGPRSASGRPDRSCVCRSAGGRTWSPTRRSSRSSSSVGS